MKIKTYKLSFTIQQRKVIDCYYCKGTTITNALYNAINTFTLYDLDWLWEITKIELIDKVPKNMFDIKTLNSHTYRELTNVNTEKEEYQFLSQEKNAILIGF